MTYNFWLKFGIKLFALILPAVTPAIKEALDTFLKNLYMKAKDTPNPFDDLFIKLLLDLLQIYVDKSDE